MRPSHSFLLASVILCTAAGCVDETAGEGDEDFVRDTSALTADEEAGFDLFHDETFDGNGRACATCHSGADGTINPAEVQARFEADPSDPLFRAIDSDDGTGSSYDALLEHAVVRVTLPLPPNVRAADDPEATHATFLRGVPTTNNVAAADGFLRLVDIKFNHDGRAGTVEDQALGAINAHYEPGRQPTETELFQLGEYQRTLFSSPQMENWLTTGVNNRADLPAGNTPSEKRGRGVFDSSCGFCHGGEFFNMAPSFSEFIAVSGGAPGGGWSSAREGATTFIDPVNEVREWIFKLPDGTERRVLSPDLGRAAVTGDIADVNRMKIPTLWGISKTAPYFSDNHAKTLEDVVDHYQDWFELIHQPGGNFHISNSQKKDLVAFLKLL